MRLTLSRPQRRDLFLVLCLMGVVPAFVTNTLPITTWLPGVEGFRWAWFDLSGTRPLFLALLLLAGVVGWPLRPRWLWLALLPLLLLALTPASRIGAAQGPLHWVDQVREAEDHELRAEAAAIDALTESKGRLDTLLARLPAALPGVETLQARWKPLDDRARPAREQRARMTEDFRHKREAIRMALVASTAASNVAAREFKAADARLTAEEKRSLGLLPAAPSPPAAELLELRIHLGLHELWRDDKRARWLEAPYQLASALLMLGVVGALGVGQRAVLAFLGAALLAALATTVHRLSGGGLATALAGLQPWCVGTLAILVLRVLVRGHLDNREIWRATPAPALRRAMAWSLVLWSPFALVLAANFWAGAAVAGFVEARIYCPSGDAAACDADPNQAPVRDSDPTRDTLREDLQVAVARTFLRFEQGAISAAAGTPGAVGAASAKLRQGVLAAYDKVLPGSLFDFPGMPRRPKCQLINPLACLASIPFDVAEVTYQRPRNRTRAALDRRVGTALASVNQAATAASKDVQAALRGQLVQVSQIARAQADATLVAWAGLSAFGNAALLFVAARAFLLVLARLLYAQNKDAFMTITPREPPLDGEAAPVRLDTPEGDELLLPLQQGRLLMKPAFDVDGAAPNTLWLPPQPWRAALARIRHGCYFLKEIEAGDEARNLSLKSTPGTNFFCWHIPECAEVAFRWDRFAGMSGSVRLRRVFSLKLGTVVLGHVSVTTARGSGLLVQHAYTRASARRTSVAQARVVGWVVGTLFRVESGKSKKNVYVDHCHVVCAEPGIAVHEAAREGRGGHGLWRELVGLLRP